MADDARRKSKYPFVFVASVNIVHQLWARCDVTGGSESAKRSMCSLRFASLNGTNAGQGWNQNIHEVLLLKGVCAVVFV